MVEQIPAAVTDPALGDAVLPRTSEAGPLGLDAEALHGVDHLRIEAGTAIKDQVAGCGIIRECLTQLLNDPGAGWVLGHVAVQDSPPVMGDDEEAIENSECERWHGEKVHRSNGLTMVVQECRPSLCRFGISGRFPHPAQHGSLRNIESKHFQFPVNARRTPCGVFGHHADDEFAPSFAHAFSSHAGPMPRKPRPIQLEPCAMPANDALRLDED